MRYAYWFSPEALFRKLKFPFPWCWWKRWFYRCWFVMTKRVHDLVVKESTQNQQFCPKKPLKISNKRLPPTPRPTLQRLRALWEKFVFRSVPHGFGFGLVFCGHILKWGPKSWSHKGAQHNDFVVAMYVLKDIVKRLVIIVTSWPRACGHCLLL